MTDLDYAEQEPEMCPVHGQRDNFREWSCPDDCEHLARELDRRIDDVKINGNFIRTWTDEDGKRWKRRFSNHVPVEEPRPW